MLTITAVICTYKRFDQATRAIKSLIHQTLTPGRYRILVVETPPSDGHFTSYLAELSAGIVDARVITEPVAGLSQARNTALRACETDLIAFLDDDALATPTWLEELVAVFEEGGEVVGAAGGRVTCGFARPNWLTEDLLPLLSILDLGSELREVRAQQWLVGANIAFRTAAIRDLGGFRTDLGRSGQIWLGNEEIELCNRLRKKGLRIFYTPEADVVHQIAKDRIRQAWLRKRIFCQVISDALCGSVGLHPETVAVLDSQLTKFGANGNPVHWLLSDKDDPAEFEAQIWFIYRLTRLLCSADLLK